MFYSLKCLTLMLQFKLIADRLAAIAIYEGSLLLFAKFIVKISSMKTCKRILQKNYIYIFS